MRVLVVDDDAIVRMSMRGIVTGLGHECLVAHDGVGAWDILQEHPVDVVVTDRAMPDLDGLELCRRIRESTPLSGYVYVVLASVFGQDEQARDGMVVGADDYLVKPVREAQLERKLIAAERVTELHRELADAHAKVAQASQLQADMLAMLGHDARQPLAAVTGFNEMNLETWEVSSLESKRELLVRADQAARRLDELIEDVLTMANLDSGTLTCRTEALDVAGLVDDVIAAGIDEAPIRTRGDRSARALGDPWHVRQILANLIGNARKYGSPPFEVTVRTGGDQVEIDVNDSGEGVPPEFVPHLFERFSRARTGVATRKPGTGFGLYIVQRLAEANGGGITYRPRPGGGSCFTVRLPLHANDLPPAAGATTST